jgi:hypothetical protein
MFARLRMHLGVPGVIAIIALVFAMLGGAYAASGPKKKANASLTSKQKKEVKQIAKSFPGPRGAPGASGSVGPKGDVGPEGRPGKDGQTGFTEVLPTGKTLVGSWSAENQWATAENNVQGFYRVPISFGIPVSSAPTVRLFSGGFMLSVKPNGELVLPPGTEAEFKALCPGSASDPQAKPGNLCIYLGAAEDALYAVGKLTGNAAFTYGWSLPLSLEAEGHASGSWAVTGA